MKIGQIWRFAMGKTNNIKQTQSSFSFPFKGQISVEQQKNQMELSADVFKDVWLTALIFPST